MHQGTLRPDASIENADDPLVRRRLMHLVRERPGVTLSDARRELGVVWGVLAHHVHTLRRQGRIVTASARGRTLMFPAPTRAVDGLANAVALHGTARRIAAAIVRTPGISAPEVQMATGASRRSTYYHVQRLVAEKLVTSDGPRSHRDLRPSSMLVRCLAGVPS